MTNSPAPTHAPCPHCGAVYDASNRVSGDRVACPACDRWFVVYFRPGGVALVPSVGPL